MAHVYDIAAIMLPNASSNTWYGFYPANERRSQPQWGANTCYADPIIPQDLHENPMTSARINKLLTLYVGTFLKTCTAKANTATSVRRRCSR